MLSHVTKRSCDCSRMTDLYRLKGERFNLPPVYWTGKILGTWPEYLRDASRARELSKERAEVFAAEFNKRTEQVHWVLEPVAEEAEAA